MSIEDLANHVPSHWAKSWEFLEKIYQKDSQLANDLLKKLQYELDDVLQCKAGAEKEEKRKAEVAAQKAQREAVIAWIHDQKSQKYDDN